MAKRKIKRRWYRNIRLQAIVGYYFMFTSPNMSTKARILWIPNYILCSDDLAVGHDLLDRALADTLALRSPATEGLSLALETLPRIAALADCDVA